MAACTKALALLHLAIWLALSAAPAEDAVCQGESCGAAAEDDGAALLQSIGSRGRPLARTWAADNQPTGNVKILDSFQNSSVAEAQPASLPQAGAYQAPPVKPDIKMKAPATKMIAKLVPEDRADSDTDGTVGDSISVSSEGRRVAVGAPWYSATGCAYVFDGRSGKQLVKLKAEDGAKWGMFGRSISISSDGSLVAVGAPGDDNENDKGSAYVFDSSTGRQLVKLKAEDCAARSQFGGSISISSDGSRVAVGAPLDDNEKGSAYVFDSSTGKQMLKLKAKGPISISSDGSRVAVGPYLFDGNTGELVVKLKPEDSAQERDFGYLSSMSSDGSRVAVEAGGVYMFDGSTGKQLVKLKGEDAQGGYGQTISISSDGSRVAVRAYAGATYLFDGSTGEQLLDLGAKDVALFESQDCPMAISISPDGDYVAANKLDGSCAYVFDTSDAFATKR